MTGPLSTHVDLISTISYNDIMKTREQITRVSMEFTLEELRLIRTALGFGATWFNDEQFMIVAEAADRIRDALRDPSLERDDASELF